MAPAARRIPSKLPVRSTPSPASQGTAIDVDEKKRRVQPAPAVPADKPGAGRSSKLGRKVESPSSLRTAGPSGQRSRTQDAKKHANK